MFRLEKMKKKVSGLISRFEKEKDDEEDDGGQGQRSDLHTDKESEDKSNKTRPTSSSPGKMVMRNVFQSLRSPGKKNKKGAAADEEQMEAGDLPLSVGARVDHALRSIATERSKRNLMDQQRYDDDDDDDDSTDKTDSSNGGSEKKRESIS